MTHQQKDSLPVNQRQAFRNIRNYLSGRFLGATRDDALLDEVLKCLFCKLLLEREKLPPFDLNDGAVRVAERAARIFCQVRDRFPDVYSQSDEVLLSPSDVHYVLTELNFLVLNAETDPVGDAFEAFIGGNSRGNSGQFFTPRSAARLLVDALAPGPNDTVLDPACGAGGFLAAVCAYLDGQGANTRDIAGNLFGIDKDAYLARLAKVHVALLTGGSSTILNGDSLSLTDGNQSLRKHLPESGVDVILTNPPFGARIVASNQDVLRTFSLAHKSIGPSEGNALGPSTKLRANVPPQVLFLERCLTLLRPGGRLGMVLPESVLSNKTYSYVVEYLMTEATVRAVIGMPEELFKTSGKGGTHTKTCLLVAEKSRGAAKKPAHSIFMAEAKWCGQDSRGRPIPYNDLPDISDNYRKYRLGKTLRRPGRQAFLLNASELKSNILCPRYYSPGASLALARFASTHDLVSVQTLLDTGVLQISTGDEVGKLAYGTGSVPFIRTSDLSNWEVKADPKHSVARSIFNGLRDKQDVRAGDILMVKDGTYLIGTCALITELDTEILYQSHLYKLRVLKRSLVDEFLLLALLSSSVVRKQIRAKRFTLDIIDSLGSRISELVLPIPRSSKQRTEISTLVKQAIESRVKARSWAKQACAIASLVETPP